VERIETSTATLRSAPAFKILPLFALALMVGCHASSKDAGGTARLSATAMKTSAAPVDTASRADGTARTDARARSGVAPSEPPSGAALDPASDCLEHGNACAGHEPPHAEAAPAGTGAGSTTVGKYGAPLGAAPAESLASVLADPSHFAGQPVRVEGHVRRACTAMGCWMELAESSADDAPACRVIMKDHAFFVPTNSAGSDARVEGTLAVRRIDPAQVAHMEHEGAAFPQKAADGSAQELRFVATGVELWRGS
jgi:hypothetical protein